MSSGRNHDKEIEAFEGKNNVSDPMANLFQSPLGQTSSVETEHLKEIVKQAYSKKDIRLKTDLNPNQIQLMTRMSLYQQRFKSNVMKTALQMFAEYSVSKKRLGRKEFVQVAQSLSPQPQIEGSPIKRRLFGE